MKGSKRLRLLEGMGYVAAVLIGIGGLMDLLDRSTTVMRTFNIFGLVFGVIVIVRLIVMNIVQAELTQQMMERPPSFDSEEPPRPRANEPLDKPDDTEE